MKYRFGRNNLYITIIVVLFVSIGLGYSIINSTILFNGSSIIGKNTWNVYFDNVKVVSGESLSSSAPSLDASRTSLSLNVEFVYPGDVYQVYTEVVNDGTIDAMLNNFSISGLSAEQQAIIDYNVTYSDGSPILEKDLLKASKSFEILITLTYISGLDSSLYPTDDQVMSVSTSLEFVQNDVGSSVDARNLNTIMKRVSSMDNTTSKYVTSADGIKFSAVGSATNGMGVYTRNGTENDTYPIYYYRGSVVNNNVLFANICWKIVRTTETGGVKLIYNGIPVEGVCNNTGDASQLDKIAFNTYENASIADSGYHFGTRYEVGSNAMLGSLGWVYGNDVTYNDGVYTLVNTITTSLGWNSGHDNVSNGYHYTCLSSETSCSEVYYIYYAGLTTAAYYIPLSDGKTLFNVLDEMTASTSNINSSNVKNYIEEWYQNNLNGYTSFLEDTVWCNDRSIYNYNGWNKDASASVDGLYYTAYDRVGISYSPSVGCVNKKDSFTVSTTKGNGLLNYPVGLITADEAILASGGNTSYLYTGSPYWTMTPSYFTQDGAHNYFFDGVGLVSALRTVNDSSVGVRPVISLKNGIEVVDGTGTVDDPYIIN